MQNQENCGKLLTVEDGYLKCPVCRHKRIMRIPPGATATGVVAYCRFCKTENIIDIDKGQCYESRSR